VQDWIDLYTQAKERDIGVTVMKMLLSAADPWSSREAMLRGDADAWARIGPFVDDGSTVAQACIRWALSDENVHCAVVGMRTMAHLEEDMGGILPVAARREIRLNRCSGFDMCAAPNPFRQFTTIHVNSPVPLKDVSCIVSDVSGRTVRDFSQLVRSGKSTIVWDGRTGTGAVTMPGVYTCTVRAGTHRAAVAVRKI
jgi:hypothetical protein